MAQKIPVRDFDSQRFNVVLAGVRYTLKFRWNETCEKWFFEIERNGETLYGPTCLTCGQWAARGLPCLPVSFGGLYLEEVNQDVTGRQALPCGSKCLWFYTSFEIYMLYGTVAS